MTPARAVEAPRALGWLVGRTVLAAAVVVLGAAWLARSVDARAWLTADGLRAAVGSGEWYGPVCYVSTIVGGMFLPIPKVVLLGLGGVLFGPWHGFAYAWLGQVLGMTVLFVVARSGLRALVQRLVDGRLAAAERLEHRLERRGVQTVAMLRLFYFMGVPISVMLSTTRLRVRDFMAGTALGVVPAVALAVASGDAVASGATTAGAAVIGVAIVVVLGVGTLVRRRFEL
jgi:uncharacterized membrane protein YdjX (TVP38/TMEM64 family)